MAFQRSRLIFMRSGHWMLWRTSPDPARRGTASLWGAFYPGRYRWAEAIEFYATSVEFHKKSRILLAVEKPKALDKELINHFEGTLHDGL